MNYGVFKPLPCVLPAIKQPPLAKADLVIASGKIRLFPPAVAELFGSRDCCIETTLGFPAAVKESRPLPCRKKKVCSPSVSFCSMMILHIMLHTFLDVHSPDLSVGLTSIS